MIQGVSHSVVGVVTSSRGRDLSVYMVLANGIHHGPYVHEGLYQASSAILGFLPSFGNLGIWEAFEGTESYYLPTIFLSSLFGIPILVPFS